MRLDRFLCEMNIGARSRVKELIRQGQVSVNGAAVRNPDTKVDEHRDEICCQGRKLTYTRFVYYMMNKPGGVVSAVRDRRQKTVLELLREEDRRDGLFPAGRLDRDTEGFLLLTNDGGLAHRLLSPGKHVDKTYCVTLDHALRTEDIRRLEEGVDIGEAELTLPGKVKVVGERTIHLTIHEGRFHQVKRMLQAVDNRVMALKRISFGGLALDECLQPGEYRKLSEEELGILREA